MFKREIILGSKKHRRKKLGVWERRIIKLVVISMAVSFVAWSIDLMTFETRVRQAQLDISRITHAAKLFRADFGRCPVDVNELISPPEGSPYIDKGVDPWGHPYLMICPSLENPKDIEVVSKGPDGNVGGRDNITSLYINVSP
jgi:hypothetical protein